MDKDIFENIRSKGGRVTKVRGEIVKILAGEECLMSRADIIGRLNKLKISPDRSTLFRELLFLTKNNVLTRNNIAGVDYYEIPGRHHHHLICLKCNAIKKVDMEKHLEEQEKLIAKANKFSIIAHSLEFYGYCSRCGS
jgi:Fur family transcriptional regulator, ferric uptake regulator